MSITLASNFQLNAALPLDSRQVVVDPAARDAIPSGVRFIGLVVHVLSTSQNWQLQGGILNANWAIYGAAPVSNFTVDTFTADGSTTAFTLSGTPAAKANVRVFIGGIYQEQSTFSLSGTTLTFSTAPPITNNIEVSYGVSSATIADQSITKVKLAPLGQQLSTSCGAFSTTSSTAVDVTNLTVTITTSGRPVVIALVDDTTGVSSVSVSRANNEMAGRINFVRASTTFYSGYIHVKAVGATAVQQEVPVSSFWTVDPAAAGTYTYKVQALCDYSTNSPVLNINNAKLIAYEL